MPKPLKDLRPGDEVIREISASKIPMPLTVTEVTAERIICGPWEFHRETGGEIDEELGWDGVTGTGSILRPVSDA